MVCFYLSLSAYLIDLRIVAKIHVGGAVILVCMCVCTCIKNFYYKTRHVKHLIFIAVLIFLAYQALKHFGIY